MKKSLLLILLLGISSFAWVQDDKGKAVTTGANADAYAKGNWRMPLMQNLRFGFYNNKENDVKQSDESSLDLNLQTEYFIAKGWAIGAGIDMSLDKTKYEGGNGEFTDNEWNANIGVLYGRSISGNKIYWNAKLFFGIGSENQKDKTSSNTYEDGFDYTRFGIVTGLDMRNGNSNVFINPWIGYDITTKDYKNDDKEDFDNFRVGVRLVSSMACREYTCDHKTKCALSSTMYDQGRSFIGYTTKGMFSFGKYDVDEANNAGSYKGNYDEGHIRLDYNYFVIDRLAIGVLGMYRHVKDEGDDFDFKSTRNSFSIGPKITYHLPVNNCWRNFFGEAGVVFGSSKDEYKSGTITSKTEESLTNFWGGVGYNFVVSPNLSFTPIINYVSANSKDKDTDDENKQTGVNVRFGFRYLF